MANTTPLKIVFMGTPDFAVPALQALVREGFQVVCCVTQPDRASGRGGRVTMPPVKKCALEHGIPVLQPDRVRDTACVQALRAFHADFFVVAAFGQILPKEVLDIPRCGCINIHASLLPRFRGAAPIQHAILEGDEETGITIMKMDEGCDTGDILLQERVPITGEDTGGSLFDKLSGLGAELITKALPDIASGKLRGIAQDDTLATDAPKLSKEMGVIDWSEETRLIERRIRAFNPWPSATTTLAGKPLKILAARVGAFSNAEADPVPGCVLSATKQGLFVKTADGVLQILRLQPQGKKEMDASAFLNGNPLESGTVLGA